ncbi:MAG: hypothetical protein JW940_32800 [Polyangiaceae bacterium]|nr:hypothetical protein [Polyangiaceae bacterium]
MSTLRCFPGAMGWLLVVACASNDVLGDGDVTATAGTLNVVESPASSGDTPAVGDPGPDGDEVSLFAAWSPTMPPLEYHAFYAAWSNQSDHSIFVEPRCCADWWRREGGGWVLRADSVPDAVGPWVELLPGQTLRASLASNLASGIYELRGRYRVGCRFGNDCSASYARTSREVWVVVRAGESSADTDNETAAAQLHASCSAEAPCPAGQTAIAVFSSEDKCTCEIPCEPSTSKAVCPTEESCSFISDSLGPICQ